MRFRKTIKMDKFLDEMCEEYRIVTNYEESADSRELKDKYHSELVLIDYLCKKISNCRIMLMNKSSNYWIAYECEKYKTVREWRNEK